MTEILLIAKGRKFNLLYVLSINYDVSVLRIFMKWKNLDFTLTSGSTMMEGLLYKIN